MEEIPATPSPPPGHDVVTRNDLPEYRSVQRIRAHLRGSVSNGATSRNGSLITTPDGRPRSASCTASMKLNGLICSEYGLPWLIATNAARCQGDEIVRR